jgi:glutathione S-transferase
MAAAVLTISSKNYSSWSLRGWLMCKLAGLEVEERARPTDDAATRAELLLLSPSFLVPALEHDGVTVWDTLSIAEYLHEIRPRPACCRPTAWRVRIAARSPARCIRGSTICARRCR